jgi:hypothetical protein
MIHNIYYYHDNDSSFGAQVYLFAVCTNIENAIKILHENFSYLKLNINNCFSAITNKKRHCIAWISSYDENQILEYKGLTCNQPCNAINIFEYL